MSGGECPKQKKIPLVKAWGVGGSYVKSVGYRGPNSCMGLHDFVIYFRGRDNQNESCVSLCDIGGN